MQQVSISASLWGRLIHELKKRGNNQRESGAFLLADLSWGNTIVDFLCYDDCEPGCLKGYI